VHDSRGVEIVNFTISLALSAGTLMASAGTPYRLVPAHFYPCLLLRGGNGRGGEDGKKGKVREGEEGGKKKGPASPQSFCARTAPATYTTLGDLKSRHVYV